MEKMEKKGTGWIPDYPDIKDYTLRKDAIQNLSNKIQISDDAGSIENLLGTVYSTLNILLKTNPELKEIQTDLEEEMLGDIRLINVDINTPETHDYDVLVDTSDNMKKLNFLTPKSNDQINIPYNRHQKLEHILPPIAKQVFKLVLIKLLSLKPPLSKSEDEAIEEIIRSLNEEESNKEDNKLQIQKLTKLIIDVIAQMLMPLNQHSNLSDVLDQKIENIKHLLESKNDHQEETKILIGQTIEAYNFMLCIKFNNVNHCNIKNLIFDAIEEIEQDIKNLLQENTQIENTLLNSIIQAYKQRQPSVQKKLYRTVNSVLQISYSDLSDLLNNKQKTSDLSQEMKNKLILPINLNLWNKIKKLYQEPDNRQKNKTQEKIQSIFVSLPEFVDLSYWCSPIRDQGELNSCTAHAGIALIEYFEKKSFGTYINGSSRFLYKVTRNLIQGEGDSGASVRDTMKAMVAFGICPEKYWSFDEDKFDQEPTAFCYSFAENYKTLKYFRLDYDPISSSMLLAQVRVLLACEIPCIFGFTLYNSVYDEVNVQKGHIPLPYQQNEVVGGHTVVAVGYDDHKVIENAYGETTEGALLIRNSWGTSWGQGGYGWLPYDYITKGLTADWWSLLKAEWLATGAFGAGASAWGGGGDYCLVGQGC